jgi:manganese/zinc/iron transport system permease protein
MLSGTRTNEWLLTGGLATGLVGIFVMMAISRWSQVKAETALGIVLSVFFGFGILLLTRIQHTNNAGQSGLDRFIFGQAATILPGDLVVMGVIAAIALSVVLILFKELKILSFDPEFAAAQGLRPGVTSTVLAALTVGVVMMGLQTVGVVLMVSLLIAPAVAARQWTRSLWSMIALSAVFGMLSGVLGAVLAIVCQLDR